MPTGSNRACSKTGPGERPGTAREADPISRLTAWVLALPAVRWLKPILDDYGQPGAGSWPAGWHSTRCSRSCRRSSGRIAPRAAPGRSGPAPGGGRPTGRPVPAARGVLRGGPRRRHRRSGRVLDPRVIGLIWGSSRFYQSLDDAVARIFLGSPRRDPIQRGDPWGPVGGGSDRRGRGRRVPRRVRRLGVAPDLPVVGQAIGLVGSALGSVAVDHRHLLGRGGGPLSDRPASRPRLEGGPVGPALLVGLALGPHRDLRGDHARGWLARSASTGRSSPCSRR